MVRLLLAVAEEDDVDPVWVSQPAMIQPVWKEGHCIELPLREPLPCARLHWDGELLVAQHCTVLRVHIVGYRMSKFDWLARNQPTRTAVVDPPRLKYIKRPGLFEVHLAIGKHQQGGLLLAQLPEEIDQPFDFSKSS
jgi:hypothetical protein